MYKIAKSLGLAALAASLIAGASLPASAETLTANVVLKASDEVPPTASSGTGTADVTYNTDTKELTWKVSYANLTGPAIMGHFHGPAEAGKNASVVVPFPSVATTPFEGKATLSDAQAADLLAGKWYVNIHTAQNKPGEIRGQVILKK
jgi:hypothetical protein